MVVWGRSSNGQSRPSLNFNALNGGNYSQYNYSGANEKFNPNYLQLRNQQAARAAQVTALVKF